MNIFTQGKNPARELHKLWCTVLDTVGGGTDTYRSAAFGRSGGYNAIHQCGRDEHERPVIRFHALTLLPDGRFRLQHQFGWKQRVAVSHGTFLGFREFRGDYVWFFDPRPPGYHESQIRVDNWLHPVPYLSEAAMGSKNWRGVNLWMSLVPDPDADTWCIVPANNQRGPKISGLAGPNPHDASRQLSVIDKFETLRNRRYVALQHLGQGTQRPTRTRLSADPFTVHQDGQKYEGDAAINVITALLNVSAPAKITPLAEAQEAHA